MDNLLSYGEIKMMRRIGKIAAKIIKTLKRFIKAGISTQDIELFFEKILKRYPGYEPAFLGYNGYPANLCVSLNDEIVHGIPKKERKIKEGDLVSVDLGIKYNGLFVDTAYTYPVGRVSPLAQRLIKVGKKALKEAIKKARIGLCIGDIGETIERIAKSNNFSVIRSFVGHGIGYNLHCPPEVPNFGKSGTGEKLLEGMVIAIEPMISAGSEEVVISSDRWTAKTKDGSLSCHFEHTVAITRRGPLVITS
ncbi:MAG: type I methionyl aminopeptidase [Candidatus Omnitrophica bacterium 4484_70.2]|nr:MAG: type I methionyl aminopeptidase [Candidatus Omnitrophica bacterium 4484_70.2]